MHVTPGVRELHGDMRFVGPLVGRESRIAVDAKHRATGQVRADLMQRAGEISEKAQHWLAHYLFVFFFVPQKPIAPVVALQSLEKTKQIFSEISRHSLFADCNCR